GSAQWLPRLRQMPGWAIRRSWWSWCPCGGHTGPDRPPHIRRRVHDDARILDRTHDLAEGSHDRIAGRSYIGPPGGTATGDYGRQIGARTVNIDVVAADPDGTTRGRFAGRWCDVRSRPSSAKPFAAACTKPHAACAEAPAFAPKEQP